MTHSLLEEHVIQPVRNMKANYRPTSFFFFFWAVCISLLKTNIMISLC